MAANEAQRHARGRACAHAFKMEGGVCARGKWRRSGGRGVQGGCGGGRSGRRAVAQRQGVYGCGGAAARASPSARRPGVTARFVSYAKHDGGGGAFIASSSGSLKTRLHADTNTSVALAAPLVPLT